jgi:hypothetical protein
MPSVSYRTIVTSAAEQNDLDYAGSYFSDALRTAWTISAHGGGLTLHTRRNAGRLAAIDKDEFAADPGLIRFRRDAKGQVTSFLVTNVRDTGVAFERRSR